MKNHPCAPGIIQNRETSPKVTVCASAQSRTEPKAATFDNIFGQIIANSPLSFFIIDKNGIVTTCSFGQGDQAVGIKSPDLVGRSLYDISREIPEIKTIIPQLMNGETGIVSMHFREMEFDIWHAPFNDDQGTKIGVAAIVINVTERWQVEEKLREERALLEDMLRFHERDRKWLAYEIHDGFVQDIAAAYMILTLLSNGSSLPPRQMRDELQKANTLVKKAMNEARQLIGGLRPPILDEMGVVPAISLLIEDFSADELKIDFSNKVQFERLDPLLEATIFRIVQQAINNIQRHSRAERAKISLVQQGQWLHLEIEDWGIGFDPSCVSEDRFGLQGIRERARLMRGRAVIDSAPGKGTRIIIDLPVAYALDKK